MLTVFVNVILNFLPPLNRYLYKYMTGPPPPAPAWPLGHRPRDHPRHTVGPPPPTLTLNARTKEPPPTREPLPYILFF